MATGGDGSRALEVVWRGGGWAVVAAAVVVAVLEAVVVVGGGWGSGHPSYAVRFSISSTSLTSYLVPLS